MMKYFAFLLGALLPLSSFAEDIEIYVGSNSVKSNIRPKVLIVFDNSGSMRTTELVKEEYDPNGNYPTLGSDHSLSSKFIYFVKGSGLDNAGVPVPDGPNEQRRFIDAINSCQTARDSLETVGYFTGYVREYAFKGQSGRWQEIPDSNGANVEILDCWEDIDLENPANAGITKAGDALPSGYPVDSLGTKTNPIYYTADVANASPDIKAGEVVTLYTENYLRWYHSTAIQQVNLSRLDIAKNAMTQFISATPSVDFGLQIFNHNAINENERDGGRIVFGIQEATPAAKIALNNIINLQLDPETNTPLCETVYEASRYFGGEAVDFGNDDSNRGSNYKGNTPPRDTSIETGNNYISPFSGCGNDVNIILITDGAPTVDNAADAKVLALPERDLDPNAPTAPGAFSVNGNDNYLPRLAWWMKNNDINQYVDDKQTASIIPIGFSLNDSDAVKMLKEVGKQGNDKGLYFTADDPSSLAGALVGAIASILEADTTFTAPSVASNNFDRTQTLDSVYYAMFSPDNGPRWQGNLKKLKITSGGIVGRDDKSAIDSDGNISPDANTFWSTVVEDGPTVAEGGVVDMFSKMTPNARTLYSDLGSSGAMALFNKANAISSSTFGSSAALALSMGILETELDEYIDWAKGADVDDEDNDNSTNDMRDDVFGDPLHSKPLVINYGGASASSQDVRIVIGTNAGALHMFEDAGSTVNEKWAFMPKEFFNNITKLKNNSSNDNKVYGIDGTAVAYTEDSNNDNIVDKAYVFFGLRRGGTSYYGLDVSDKNAAPELLWKKDQSDTGFSRMGQTWSTPKIAFSKINIVSGKAEPVIIVGGGYSINKDTDAIGSADTVGNAIYMLDAKTGDLKWSLTPDTSPAFPGTDSIPSSIATMDSDSDGFVDRLYFGDTGGIVWRVDMPGTDTSKWKATKLASLGSETVDADDRRFFAEPTIARAMFTETFEHNETINGVSTTTIHHTQTPYDAILIGSGDRTSPLDSNTLDKLFMIKDKNIITQSFATDPTEILLTDLYDYTNNPFQGLTPNSPAYNALAVDVSLKKGWFIDLLGTEEKSVAKPEAIAGVAYYSAFTPSNGSNICKPEGGESQIYAVDLALGVKIYTDRVIQYSDSLPDGITLVTIPESTTNPNAPSNQVDGDPLAILAGEALRLLDADGNAGVRLKTMRTHLVVTENDN